VKWEVVCLGREEEREGRPTSREGRGGKRRGKECVGREKADNGGVARSGDLEILRWIWGRSLLFRSVVSGGLDVWNDKDGPVERN